MKDPNVSDAFSLEARAARCADPLVLAAGSTFRSRDYDSFRRAQRGMVRRVTRSALHRCLVALLLLARLVLGEFAHALPDTQHGAMNEMDSAHVHCSTHAEAPAVQLGATQDEHSPAPASTCCHAGQCECPCLHVPVLAMPAMLVNSRLAAAPPLLRSLGAFNEAFVSGLFRPPA